MTQPFGRRRTPPRQNSQSSPTPTLATLSPAPRETVSVADEVLAYKRQRRRSLASYRHLISAALVLSPLIDLAAPDFIGSGLRAVLFVSGVFGFFSGRLLPWLRRRTGGQA